LALEFDFPDFFVEIDKMRTQQILINLISNAIKFSKPGDKIVLEVCHPELLIPGSDQHKITIKVIDEGIGLN